MLERPTSTAGWKRFSLGEVAINSTVATLTPEDDGFERYIIGKHIPGDGRKITTWNEVGDGEFGSRIRTIIRNGDIVCTTRGPKLRVAVATFDCLSAHTNFILRTKDSSVLMQEFLQAIACSEAFQEHLRRNFRGSTNFFVNWSDAAAFEFLLPPIQEQARLLEALVAVNEVRDGLGSVADSAVMAMRSLCKRLFTEKRKEIARTRIGQVATVRNGTTPSRKNPDFWNGAVPWLPTGKVNERYIEAAEECITELALRKCSLRLIPAGSTLVAMIGEGTTRGKAALLRIDATTNQNFAAVSPGEGIVPEFLFYQLESCYEPLRHWSHGTNQHALNTKLVSDFPIWVPGIDEQREIVAEIAALEDQRVAAERRRDGFQGVYKKISEKVLEACWV